MSSIPEPEVIPPHAPIRGPLTDEKLDRLASWLDDGLRVPGTQIHFGLDPLIGLIPGLGDALGAIASAVFIFAGWQRGLPKVTLLRMVVNILIDSLGGTLPLVGDLFDFYWKSNRMNYKLLRRHSLAPHAKHTHRDWLFLWAIALGILGVIVLPVLLLLLPIIYLLRR